MNRFIILATLVAAVAAEAPVSGGYGGAVSAGSNFANSGGFSSFGGSSSGGSGINEYVDEALLARVAAVIASNGDGTASGQDNEGSQYVDQTILQRVASSLGSDQGSSSRGLSSGYGAPAAPSGGSSSLGQPEPAQRIAEWDLSEQRQASSGSSDGGYSSGGSSAPSRSFSSGSSSGGSSFGRPEPAQKIAEFDASQTSGNTGFSGSSSRGSSSGGYN